MAAARLDAATWRAASRPALCVAGSAMLHAAAAMLLLLGTGQARHDAPPEITISLAIDPAGTDPRPAPDTPSIEPAEAHAAIPLTSDANAVTIQDAPPPAPDIAPDTAVPPAILADAAATETTTASLPIIAPAPPPEPPELQPVQPMPPPVQVRPTPAPIAAAPPPPRRRPRPAPHAAAHRPAPSGAGASLPAAPAIPVDDGPLLIANPRFRLPPSPPAYPARARDLGQEGEVVVRARLDLSGAPEEVVVHRSSGFDLLDRAALAAVRRWAFEPGRRGGQAVPAWVQVPVRFALR